VLVAALAGPRYRIWHNVCRHVGSPDIRYAPRRPSWSPRCPAHLVHKWIEDFDRFFGGGLREVTAETIRQQGLSVPGVDTWVVSLNLAAANPAVLEALHPDTAGWDAVIFDEAHRMTPTAGTFHRVGRHLAKVPNAVLLTATPHRGDEWFFSELMHLVDPDIFPTSPRPDRRGQAPAGGVALRPGPLHFLRRMKEQLVDFDNRTPLFKYREARNIKVPLNSAEQRHYDAAQDLVERFFPQRGRQLAAMVYGKRTASSLHSLAETLRRRSEMMGTADRITGALDIDDIEDPDAEQRVTEVNSVDARAERKEVKTLLADIDELLNPQQVTASRFVPSKWPDLILCLSKHGISPGEGQAVVFTEFADTAAWLTRKLTEEGFTAESYTGSLSHTDRAEVQARFMAGGFQVIVTTDAGNEGIDLQAAAVLVNWDVPWSLVRLEQRMGRIHRIGQRDKVWLYNLVAAGTREGDAHQRLLDRLVEAANELGGQMFDSLNAILERARTANTATEPDRLMRLFYEGGDSLDGDWPTIEQIRAARDAHFAEMRELASDVDIDEADIATRDDRLGRVNPIIVERFLDRAHNGGLLECQKVPLAKHGFYYLTANHPSHGWTLPEPLAASETVLVATRADARKQAAAEGKTRADEAVMLGPADPALRQLVEGMRRRLAAEAIQGAMLCDETSAVDYTLFVHECAITEGAANGDRQQRPRPVVYSQLVRVDSDGTARVVSWDALANLAPPQHYRHPSARPGHIGGC
jgi:superfamily II DNA or RNA helicase